MASFFNCRLNWQGKIDWSSCQHPAGVGAHVPKSEGERACLYAICPGEQSLTHEPQASQTQVPMQAHSSIPVDCALDAPHGDTNLLRQFLTVHRPSDVIGQECLDVAKYLEMPNGVRARFPHQQCGRMRRQQQLEGSP